MNVLFSRILLALIFLLCFSVVGSAQPTSSAIPRAIVYTTAPKTFYAKLKNDGQGVYEVDGLLSFTILTAQSDDTILGALSYTIPDHARQKIAALTGRPLAEVPDCISRKNVVAYFENEAAPPVIHLLIDPMEVDVEGAKISFGKITLDINARDATLSRGPEKVEAMITIWARQILAELPRRGVILAVNRAITGRR